MTVTTKHHRERFIDKLMNETILYGGLPLRRCDVYHDVMKRTGIHWLADQAAFGLNRPAIDTPALSYAEFNAIVGDF